MPELLVIDLFSGAGGFSLGAASVVGRDAVVGFEIDGDALATHEVAGLRCHAADLAVVAPPEWLYGLRLHLHGSPPCTTFSSAGGKRGSSFVDDLCVAVRDILAGDDYDEVVAGLPPDVDPLSKLVLVPARWIADLEPETVSLEQVRSVMPIWEAYSEALELLLGYETWTEVLSAEQYGVPQTRERAWLGASLSREVRPPAPTHARFGASDGLPSPVAMGDAVPSLLDHSHYAPAGVSQTRNRARPRLVATAPAPTVTSQGNHYVFDAASVAFGEKLSAGAAARRITDVEMAVLQGFPVDYPWQGGSTSRRRQIGNAIPPPVAEAVLRSLLKGESDEW